MRRASAERGAAAVEFAIVLPVLIAILCGTIDWGYYFFTREIVVNASREGARVGTLQVAAPLTPDEEAKKAAEEYLESAKLDLTKAEIATAKPDGAACPAGSACISITYTIDGAVTGFAGSFVPDKIVAYSQMRR